MDEKPKIKKQGISLRMVYAGIIIGAVIICGMMVFLTFRLSSAFSELSEATDAYIELDKAANELMEAPRHWKQSGAKTRLKKWRRIPTASRRSNSCRRR